MAAENINNQPVSELYIASRGQINHYHLSIGLRLIWLNNSQAFMFGIYSATVVVKAPNAFLLAQERNLAMVIPIIGFLISLFILGDVIASLIQMHKLNCNYNHGPEEERLFPLVYTNLFNRMLQHLSPVLSSLLFILIWGGLILFDHGLLNL
ncbi:hypothetical protein MUY27_05570 [Mucilaginibacter sp. RS28]|uniref:Uncharacterized protein n=1 Tax=Mucilaginibacter straminoryzae TaxID=2932774 RepID=A0A9X1X0V1_9SPHI|nr:hypothetical protein [Mucilaginibacter straminoryzae]MCJ8209167.1 hypothetical protein [Mucilaginibacter straminoryzae]